MTDESGSPGDKIDFLATGPCLNYASSACGSMLADRYFQVGTLVPRSVG